LVRLRNRFLLVLVGGVVLGAMVVLLVTFATGGIGQGGPTPEAPVAALQGEPRPAPEATVRQYYFLINDKQLDEAYGLLSMDSPARRPFDEWSQAFGETTSVDMKSAILRHSTDSEAEVYVEIGAVDVLSDGTEIDRQFAGTWQLVWADGHWLLQTPSVRQTGEEVRAPKTTPTAAPTRTRPTPAPTFPVVRKMILVGGIDSGSSCSDSGNTFFARREKVKEILQPYLPTLQSWDIYGLSYADQYAYCVREAGPGGPSSSGGTYPLSKAPEWAAPPIYNARDTCGGVSKASASLGRLIDHILKSEPGAKFDIIAHSMGGLVASYYVAQQGDEFLKQHIHSVVLLDSPVSPGLQITNLESFIEDVHSACTFSDPSWQDMLPESGVVGSISDPSRTTLRVRFSAVLATFIGQSLPGMSANNVRYAQGYTSGTAGGLAGGGVGLFGCLFGPTGCVLGPLIGGLWGYANDVVPEHSAVWYDPVTAQAIIEAVTAP
jgi:hypothetical protein